MGMYGAAVQQQTNDDKPELAMNWKIFKKKEKPEEPKEFFLTLVENLEGYVCLDAVTREGTRLFTIAMLSRHGVLVLPTGIPSGYGLSLKENGEIESL